MQRDETPLAGGVKAVRAELDSLTPCQRPQARRKVSGAGHAGPVHQNRNDTDTAVQRSLDLQADKVVRVVQAPPPVLVGELQRTIADHAA
jgi:hypothetical protein